MRLPRLAKLMRLMRWPIKADKINNADEANVAMEANKSKANEVVTDDLVVAVNVAKDVVDTDETIGTSAASDAI